MSLTFASLNSGSNGNCYYVGDHNDAVLIDAGLTCRETENRLSRMGLSFRKIRALFITHEHTDHTSGMEVIARRYGIPVWISEGTLANSRVKPDPEWIRRMSDGMYVRIGDLTVEAFTKRHDGAEPLSFTISDADTTVGVYTDIGSVCEKLIGHFSRCHAVFLESNYDERMLDEGPYPPFLKNRIKGGHGHLSNRQALELFVRYRSAGLSHLLLSHLSRENNSPEITLGLFQPHANGTFIGIASRDSESPVYQVNGNGLVAPRAGLPGKPEQLKMF